MKFLFLVSFFVVNIYSFTTLDIVKISTKNIILQNTKNAKLSINQSAFITSYDNDLEYISAIVQIYKITSDKIYTKIIKENPFKNEDLPYLKAKIQKDDKAVFDTYAKNILIIAPNKQTFLNIQNKVKIKTIPPMYIIIKEDLSSIDKQTLQDIALKNHIGYFYIANNNKLFKVDGYSVKIINKTPLQMDTKNAIKPFYSKYKSSSLFSSYDYQDTINNILEIK